MDVPQQVFHIPVRDLMMLSSALLDRVQHWIRHCSSVVQVFLILRMIFSCSDTFGVDDVEKLIALVLREAGDGLNERVRNSLLHHFLFHISSPDSMRLFTMKRPVFTSSVKSSITPGGWNVWAAAWTTYRKSLIPRKVTVSSVFFTSLSHHDTWTLLFSASRSWRTCLYSKRSSGTTASIRR